MTPELVTSGLVALVIAGSIGFVLFAEWQVDRANKRAHEAESEVIRLRRLLDAERNMRRSMERLGARR